MLATYTHVMHKQHSHYHQDAAVTNSNPTDNNATLAHSSSPAEWSVPSQFFTLSSLMLDMARAAEY